MSLEPDTLSSCFNPKEKLNPPATRKTALEDENKAVVQTAGGLEISTEDEIQSHEVVP